LDAEIDDLLRWTRTLRRLDAIAVRIKVKTWPTMVCFDGRQGCMLPTPETDAQATGFERLIASTGPPTSGAHSTLASGTPDASSTSPHLDG